MNFVLGVIIGVVLTIVVVVCLVIANTIIEKVNREKRYRELMSLDVYLTRIQKVTIFEQNITHNLGKMAKEAGIYMHLWRPDELGITKAGELIAPLLQGIEMMEDDPERFIAFNPENGYGSYARFLPWLKRYLEACEYYPDADVEVSR